MGGGEGPISTAEALPDRSGGQSGQGWQMSDRDFRGGKSETITKEARRGGGTARYEDEDESRILE